LRLLGTFEYAMDERGRLPLPPRYRDAFRDGIVLSQGSPDACLRLYTAEAFEALAAQYTAETALHQRGRDLRAAFFGRSLHVELDKQHRILIPSHLRAYAGLSAKVLVVGAGDYLEIWSPPTYEEKMAWIDAQLPTLLESVQPRDN
jgi:MraZ protein